MSDELAYFEFEFHVGEDFDVLMLIEKQLSDGTWVPLDGATIGALFSDVKQEPDGSLLFSATVTPFEGDDGEGHTYVLADGQYRYFVPKESLEALQPEDIETGFVDLFADLLSGNRRALAAGAWGRTRRTTEVFT